MHLFLSFYWNTTAEIVAFYQLGLIYLVQVL